MRKIIKIGFPILCIAVIGGTFILLNKTVEKINRNKLPDKEEDSSFEENEVVENVEMENFEVENTENIDPEDIKIRESQNEEKAIEIVKKLAPSVSNSNYTNEGKEDEKYIVAIRDSDTDIPSIIYSVDIEEEKIEIYTK